MLHTMLERSSFIYFENFIPTNYFKELQQLMTSGDFEWFYRNASTESDKESSFTHALYNDQSGQVATSHHSDRFKTLFDEMLKKFGGEKIIRARAVLYPKRSEVTYTGKHYDVIDFDSKPVQDPIKIALLNFHTCNGGTVVGNTKVPSVANSAILFNNTTAHSGFIQSDTPIRIVLNFVFVANN